MGGMSWEVSADTTGVLSADTTDVLSADTTDVLSEDAFHAGPGFARLGTSKMESGHHLDKLEDLSGIFVGVVLTR